MSPSLVLACAGAAVVGGGAGGLVNRLAGRFPWPDGVPLRTVAARPGPPGVRRPVLEVGTAVLAVLVVLRWGVSWEVPAFLLLGVAGVLLAVIDLQHRLLPDRVVLTTLVCGAVLLLPAAAIEGAWSSLLRAALGAAALFAVFLVLAVISPSGLGMGDVKLAAVLGLFLGWLGWSVVLLGAVAGFVVQAVLALALLALGRVRRDSELPFGPAMLIGAALTMAIAGT